MQYHTRACRAYIVYFSLYLHLRKIKSLLLCSSAHYILFCKAMLCAPWLTNPDINYIIEASECGVIVILRKNDIIEAYIDSTGYEGEGIAKVDGYPVFVRHAAEGDRLKIRILKANKNYGFGKTEEIIEPSAFRRDAVCSSFGRCGGCTMMHIDYEKQLAIKANTVTNNLRKIAHLNEEDYVFEGISGGDEYGYRNKAQFPVALENGVAVCGFYAPGSHRVVKCSDCKIQNEQINAVAREILNYINENHVSVYDEKTGKGIVRHIYVRTSRNGQIMAVIVANSKKELPFKEKLIEKLAVIDGVTSVIQNINLRSDNVVMGNNNITLWGRDGIVLTLNELQFKVSPNSFFQVNPKQTEKLYAKALEYAGLTGSENVFDLYCGVGSISLYMARNAKRVYGVEIVEDAVKNAKENAVLNGISNAEFYAGDCTEAVHKLVADGASADVVVVDPPRKGCDGELLKLINDISPKRLVYVSCNSATLARDADELKKYGYKLIKAAAFDLFPQSAHVECVSCFVRI